MSDLEDFANRLDGLSDNAARLLVEQNDEYGAVIDRLEDANDRALQQLERYAEQDFHIGLSQIGRHYGQTVTYSEEEAARDQEDEIDALFKRHGYDAPFSEIGLPRVNVNDPKPQGLWEKIGYTILE